jgi:carboxyl-terminal processing protease
VNEHSASASEIVAGALLDNRRALIIGMRTYGKGSVQDVVSLDGGGRLKMTVAYYYLPSGRLVHRLPDAEEWGVDPHIAVPMEAAAQREAMRQRHQMEQHHRPPANGEANDQAEAPPQLADVQLQRAIDTLVGLTVLQNEPVTGRDLLPLPDAE